MSNDAVTVFTFLALSGRGPFEGMAIGAGAVAGKTFADRFAARSVLPIKTVHCAFFTGIPSQSLQTEYDSLDSRRYRGFSVTFEAW